MNLSIKIIENVDKKTKHELDAFSNANWGKHVDSPEEIRKNFFATPDFSAAAYQGSRLVGLLFVYIKKILYGGKEIVVGGIGGVVVDKSLRHKGIATQILKAAVIEMKKRGIAVSMLCTEIDKLGKLYQKVGFKPLGKAYYFYDKMGKLQKSDDGMIAQVGSKEVYNELINSNEKINVGSSNF